MLTTRPPTFLWLMFALLGMFLVYPFALLETGGTTIVNAASFLIVGAAVYSLRLRRSRLAIGLAFAIPAVALDWACDIAINDSIVLPAVSSAMYAAFHTFVTAVIMRHILAARRANANEVWASACVYLLIALVWADVFHVVAVLRPNSFMTSNASIRLGGSGGAIESDLLYYSLSTLTTLGLGDITPADRIARSLTALEAVAGQLCLAILVARFVGLHIVSGSEAAVDETAR